MTSKNDPSTVISDQSSDNDVIRMPRPIQLTVIRLKSNDPSRLSIDSISEIKKPQNRPSCRIKTELLYIYTVKEEIISVLKVSLWVFMAAVCGIGYEGRVTISKWFGVLETIYIYPIGICVVAVAYSVFDIVHESLHRTFFISQILFGHSLSIAAIWLDVLVFGNLFNGVLAICYIITVHVWFSRRVNVRANFFFLWAGSVFGMFVLCKLMLYYELWTVLVITTIPADILLTSLAVYATKTCDRFSFLQAASLVYCCYFESYRFLSLLSIVEQESQWTWILGRFCIVDFFCRWVSKSEIFYYINKNTWLLGAFSETYLLAARVTRGCINVTAFCFPIWLLGFDFGRMLMGSKVAISEHTQLVLMIHYVTELGSELGLLFTNMIYDNYTDYKFARMNFIPTLKNRIFIVAYGRIPAVFLMMLILIV